MSPLLRYIYGVKGLPGDFQETLKGFQEDAPLSNENFIPEICVNIES